MKLKLLSLFVGLLSITSIKANAQSLLAAGDILFTGYDSSSNLNWISFVILKPGGIEANTVFHITDNGYNTSIGALTTNEGDVTVTVSAALPQYTEISLRANATGTAIADCRQNSSGTFSTENISATVAGTFSLSIAGDQVFVFQGTLANPVFVTGLHVHSEMVGSLSQPASTAAGWDAIANPAGPNGWAMSSNRSGIPPTLTNAVNALMAVQNPGGVSAEKDNVAFNCFYATFTDLDDMKSKLTNKSKWKYQDSVGFTLPSACNYLSLNAIASPKFSCAPNPTSGIVTLEGNEEINQIRVFSALGQEIMKTDVNSQSASIDLSSFPAGCYLLMLVSADSQQTMKIIRK